MHHLWQRCAAILVCSLVAGPVTAQDRSGEQCAALKVINATLVKAGFQSIGRVTILREGRYFDEFYKRGADAAWVRIDTKTNDKSCIKVSTVDLPMVGE